MLRARGCLVGLGHGYILGKRFFSASDPRQPLAHRTITDPHKVYDYSYSDSRNYDN